VVCGFEQSVECALDFDRGIFVAYIDPKKHRVFWQGRSPSLFAKASNDIPIRSTHLQEGSA
jgi:hypothetical protein